MNKPKHINAHIDKLKIGGKIKQGFKNLNLKKLDEICSISKHYNNTNFKYEYKISIKNWWFNSSTKKWHYDKYDLMRYREYDQDDLIAYGLSDSCLNDIYYFKLPKPIVTIEVLNKYYKNGDGENELNSFNENSRQITLIVEGTFEQYCKITDLFYNYFNNTDETTDNYLYHLQSGGCVDSDDENNIHEEPFFISNEDNWKNDTCMIRDFKKEFTKFKKSIKI